jgi:hypothetical protein
MKIKLISLGLIIFSVMLLANAANGQTEPIKVRFQIDGEESHQPFRIQLVLNQLVLKPEVKNDSFFLPGELANQEKVDVRFISGKYDLYYDDVHLSKFSDGGEFVFGVDNKPFDEDHLRATPPPGQKLQFVYYLEFLPKDVCGTALTVHVFK